MNEQPSISSVRRRGDRAARRRQGGGSVMPADMSRYPANWKDIRAHILERAQHRCEFCGAVNYEPHPVTGSKVVLTIAHHPDPDPMNCADGNLYALCQKCHNKLDAPMRAQHSKATRAAKKAEAVEASGQLSLFGGSHAN